MEELIIPKNFNPGCLPDPVDKRDRKFEDVAMGAALVDWSKEFRVDKSLGFNFIIENQNGSLSCVGQAVSKYGEVLNFVEELKIVDLSPKSIYGQIFIPATGGAYIRSGMAVPVNVGIAEEKDVPSYEYIQMSYGLVKNPPTEDFMRDFTLTDDLRAKMKRYKAKEYRSIGNANFDLIATAIRDNNGAVTGFNGSNEGWFSKEAYETGIVVPPKPGESVWGHAIFLIGYGQDERGKYVLFINSWSESWGLTGVGKAYLNEYASQMFSIWTLVDLPNNQLEEELMSLLTNNNYKIIQETEQTGSVGFIQNGKVRVAANKEQIQEILLAKIMREDGVAVNKETWDKLPKEPLH